MRQGDAAVEVEIRRPVGAVAQDIPEVMRRRPLAGVDASSNRRGNRRGIHPTPTP